MVVLVVYVLVLLILWWAWLRQVQESRDAGAAPAPLQRPPQDRPAAGPHARREARHPRSLEPPLTEDDVIAFGLALERSADVVRQAAADPGRAPAGQPAQRDVPGP